MTFYKTFFKFSIYSYVKIKPFPIVAPPYPYRDFVLIKHEYTLFKDCSTQGQDFLTKRLLRRFQNICFHFIP